MQLRRLASSPFAVAVTWLALASFATPAVAGPGPGRAIEQGSAPATISAGQVQLQLVTGGLSAPVGIVNAGDGTNRLFVLEKGGLVRVVAGGSLQPGAFLDVRGVAGGFTTDGERGLLGLAFHPDFEINRKLFAFYTDGGGDLVVGQLTANSAGTAADATTIDPILEIEHSARSNHNGGQLLFDASGHLFVFTGDGGGGGDPDENAQDATSLLGKALRLSPDLAGGYDIPPGNPYAGGTPGRDEIWALGLRNPWRASFDRETGDLWIADVGQGSWEEVNRSAGGAAGVNYGWDCREGLHAFETAGCSGISFTDPIAEYGHGAGDCSVTGGYVYRGSVFPDLIDQYVLGDFCSGRIWTLDAAVSSPVLTPHGDTTAMITSFGEAESGELYLTDYSGGVLYRVIAPPFSDVAGSAFVDSITWLAERGITTGCGGSRFCPTSPVTREQMASFLVRALGLSPSATDQFTDDEDSAHEADINALAEAGITTGCGGGRFCPTATVTREQMASFLVRAFDLPATGTDFFGDDESSIHERDINALAQSGVTTGCGPGVFCPTAGVTREQMAAFLHRSIGG